LDDNLFALFSFLVALSFLLSRPVSAGFLRRGRNARVGGDKGYACEGELDKAATHERDTRPKNEMESWVAQAARPSAQSHPFDDASSECLKWGHMWK
jgi:hypothetical protein